MGESRKFGIFKESMGLLALKATWDGPSSESSGGTRLYAVEGFTDGTVAFVGVHPSRPAIWVIRRSLPGKTLEELPQTFKGPNDALAFLDAWYATISFVTRKR
jgi:hypothetical protein